MADSTPRPTLLESLRGDRTRRPERDPRVAPGLRARLDDGIYQRLGATPAAPVLVRASSLRRASAPALADTANARLRGVLVNQLLALLVVGYRVSEPGREALHAWRASCAGGELADYFAGLDGESRAKLIADVDAHFVTLRRAFADVVTLPSARSQQRSTLLLSGGAVELRDLVDLVLGSPHDERRSVVLVDVTTSPLGADVERTLGYHALVQTLRASVAPLRVCAFSSATGESYVREVDDAMLSRALEDILEALHPVEVAA